MNIRHLLITLLTMTVFLACNKNTVSKIPNLTFIGAPQNIKVNIDEMVITFKIIDGDADLGNDTLSGVYCKDSRYDSIGFIRSDFPAIDSELEDPKKGIVAKCDFFPVPQPTPRFDSLHMALGDTFTYEIYVVDRAGNKSNHITTPQIIILP
ncbi:MAG: hypothetical protein JWQ38_2013 [Flavipsychrobacter sp.]|nr:hypothetical protein [Flavipsychrobacter sp.]